MGVSYERGLGPVPGVDGLVAVQVQVTRRADGEVHMRVITEARVDGVPIGTDDERYPLIAQHFRAL